MNGENAEVFASMPSLYPASLC